MPNEPLVTAERIGDRFGVSVGTVNAWVRKRLIPFVRVTRKTVRFSLAEVEAALRSRCANETALCEKTVCADHGPTARSASDQRVAGHRSPSSSDRIEPNGGGPP